MAQPDPSFFDDLDADAEAAADAEGLADLKAGRVVSHAAVKRWLLSWCTTDELPTPKIGD